METSASSLVNESQAGLKSSGCVGGKAVVPQPAEALLGVTPPPFLTKTYEMVDDPSIDDVVSWSRGNNSFIVWNPPLLSSSILPKYFKHNNFSSFVRQLNTYGFRKVDPDRWEFAAEGFIRGQKHLLKTLRRRKPVNPSQSGGESSQGQLELSRYGNLGEDITQLKHDKNVLMHELMQMRQQQQTTDQTMKYLGQRLAATEQRQRQMMTFLAKTMQNPTIFANLFQTSGTKAPIGAQRRKRCLSKKKQLTQGGDSEASSSEGRAVSKETTMIDPTKASFAEFMNSTEPTSTDAISKMFQELFHAQEWGNYGQGDETSISDSDPHLNLGLDVKREAFLLQNSSSSKSSSTEEMAGEAEKESFEGSEEMKMAFFSNEQHMTADSISFLFDNSLEEDWNELFESMEVYDKAKTSPEECNKNSRHALVKHGARTGQGTSEDVPKPERSSQQ